jgi:hypothetical protein
VGSVCLLSGIKKSEELSNTIVSIFVDGRGKYIDQTRRTAFGHGLEIYAYDNIGSVFFGKPLGFLDCIIGHGEDSIALYKAKHFYPVVTLAPAYTGSVLMVFDAAVPSLLRVS